MRLVKIDKEALLGVLNRSPYITQKELGKLFGCNSKTIARELRRHGLDTKPWRERNHTIDSKLKISRARKGKKLGAENPNYRGNSNRTWLNSSNHPFRIWHKRNPEFAQRQRGSNNPVHRIKHKYKDPEYKAKVMRGLVAHVDKRRSSTYEEVYGVVKAQEYREKLRQASPARLAKFKRKITEPERKIQSLLIELDVPFVMQAPIGYYTVDFLLEEPKIVIQADGDFWHAHPKKYPEGTLTPTQLKQKRLDASCNAFLQNRGYCVIRIWELDLHQNLDTCRYLLKKTLEQRYG